jgi:Tfp pilus assembly pilus retraction ATPase PilT
MDIIVLGIAANIAEIIAGIAILIAALKAWPLFTRIEGLAKTRKPVDISADLERLRIAIHQHFGHEPSPLTPQGLLGDVLSSLGGKVYDLHFEYFASERDLPGRISYTKNEGDVITRPELVTVSHEGYHQLMGVLREFASDNGYPDNDTAYLEFEKLRLILNFATSITGPVATLRVTPRLVLTVDQLGMVDGPLFKSLLPMITQAKPGVIVVAGANGSGKSTTASALLEYATRQRNYKVASAEFPIEFVRSDGVTQFSCDHESDFDAAYRSALSQNPDILFLGAPEPGPYLWDAYTRHKLVLGVASTYDAAAAVEMLCRQGRTSIKSIDAPFIVIGQTLAGILCKKCRQSYELTVADRANIKQVFAENDAATDPVKTAEKYSVAAGCDACASGYSGRIAMNERLDLTTDMLSRTTVAEIRKLAQAGGMSTLQHQALAYASQGLIDFRFVQQLSEALSYEVVWRQD